MKFAPQELSMKIGGRLLLREAQGTDAGAVLAYLNRVGGESDNLLFGKDGFPLPVEREAAFLERQRQEEHSILCWASRGRRWCVWPPATPSPPGSVRPTGPAFPSPWPGTTGARALAGAGWRPLSPLPGRRGWRSSSWRCAPTTPGPWP